MNYPTGWRQDHERSYLLARGSRCLLGVPVVRERPKSVDPRGWLKIEDQQQTSSCVGHATSSACEMLAAFQSGGKTTIQLSRWQAYISAQTEDKLLGQDQGATISGTVRALQKRGICREDFCAFPGRYVQEVSQEAWDDAETRQVRRHVPIHSHTEALDWLGGAMGAIIIGVPVDQAFMSNRTGEINRMPTSGGGHAMAIVGYTEDGRLILVNSWGRGWGDSGFGLVSERAFAQCCRMAQTPQAEVWGITDMERPEPRKLDWVSVYA